MYNENTFKVLSSRNPLKFFINIYDALILVKN